MTWLLVFFASSSAMAQPLCSPQSWSVVGRMDEAIKSYDAFVDGLEKSKNPLGDINSRINRDGLLITLTSPGKIKGVANYLEGEEPGGTTVGLFLRKMKAPAGSNLSLETVYEIANPKSSKAIRQWRIPASAKGPQGLEGNFLFLAQTIAGICSKSSQPAVLKINPDGRYLASDTKLDDQTTIIPAEKCPAAKDLFKDSAFAICSEHADLKSKKKRTLVWQAPMT